MLDYLVSIALTAGIYAIFALGLNLQWGYAGLLNFGQVAFVAVGAYSVGVIVVTLGLTLWLAIPISIFASVVLALVLGIPTLRLRADYLAIVTIAASEIVRQLVRSIALRDVLGGANGINGKMGQEFHDLNPFPADLGEVLARYPKVLIPEMNLGQLAMLIRAKFLVDAQSYTQVSGVPFRAADMEARIREEMNR